MANYTPTFTKPYPSGWVDKPSKTTPATAAIMNSYDTAIAALEAYLRDNAIKNVSADTTVKSGTKIATITIDGTEYVLYSPSVSYESAITGGTKVGTITVGANTFDVYAPTSSTGGSTVSVVPKTLTGTNIAEITVDGTTYQLYAPTSGSSGSTVTAEATLTEGTQIGKITIDGVETILYAPTASPITVDSELSATSENAIQNKAVDAAVKNLQQQIDAGGAGGSITVDSALSTTSVNPVQNKVVTAELNKKIETLDDESQAPDVVNFDLDSELSLTSVKGVQNKAIAEEFQKYANGTKVVAKATEANTATTASNAEKVNGHTVGADVPSNAVFTDTVYDDSAVKASIQNIVNGTTQVGSATKATQDAQGNVIDTTYAKKAEIPQGTVVDDALSSTSINPVQNKVVKAELDKVNSNLDDYEQRGFLSRNIAKYDISLYKGKTAGVDATLNSDGTISFSGTASVNSFLFNDLDLTGKGIRKVAFNCTNKLHFIVVYMDGTSSGYKNGDTVFEIPSGKEAKATRFYIEKDTNTSGIVAKPMFVSVGNTEFTPYIAQSTAQLNESLDDYGFKNVYDGLTRNGYYSGAGEFTSNNGAIANVNPYKCNAGDIITIKTDITRTDSRIVFLNSSGGAVSYVDNDFDKVSVPANATSFVFNFSPTNFGHIGVYINNAIDEIKNDLSNLKDGTTSVAKAVADEDGNNIKSTYATKTEVVAVEDVEVEFNSELFSNPTYYCKCIGKMCFLYFTAAFKKSGSISHLTRLISIKNSKYYAIIDYASSRLFIGAFGGSNDLKGNLVMYNQSTIAVQSDTSTVLETEAMWGSIQWMIK